ncbi:phage tail protein, partial [Xanthomonas codiaei]|nr:phage tail protein [Xanthomonas codiaei]
MDLTPTTELEAVNEMLAVIGEQPVSALEAVGNTDVAIAIRTLRGVSREVQTTAWWFNTDESYTFVLNAENRVPLPNLILSIRP